jgi:Holliday junction resolvase
MKDDFDLSPLKRKKKINSRTKGNTFERKICKLLNEALKTTEFSRSPGSGAFATTHSLPKHLALHGDILTPQNFPYFIECKKGYNKLSLEDLLDEKSLIYSFFTKAKEQAEPIKKIPVLIIQQDRKEILCILEETYDLGYGLSNFIKDKQVYNIRFFSNVGNFICIRFLDFIEFIK